MSLVMQGVRAGVFTTIGMSVGRLISPVTSIVGTTSSLIVAGNGMINRTVERATLNSQTMHQTELMGMKIRQREALCEYGEKTEELVSRYEGLNERAKLCIKEWENKFPLI